MPESQNSSPGNTDNDENNEDDRKPAAKPSPLEARSSKSGKASIPPQVSVRDQPDHSNSTESPAAEASSKPDPKVDTLEGSPDTASIVKSGIRQFVSGVPDSKKALHKQILFEMFVNYDAERLAVLSQKAGAGSLDRFLPQKDSVKLPGAKKDVLTKIAGFVGALQEQQRHESILATPRRKGYAERTLEELTRETREWQRVKRPAQRSVGIRSFALKYNECSVTAVCKWAGSLGVNYTVGGATRVQQIEHRPTCDVKFRRCDICLKWGHYEVECPRMTRDHVVLFAREMKGNQGNKASDPFERTTTEQQHGPKICSKKAKATFEAVEGFLIEQRGGRYKEPKRKGPRRAREYRTQPVETTELEGFLIKEGRSVSALKGLVKIPVLEEGNLVAWVDNREEDKADQHDNDGRQGKYFHTGVVVECNARNEKARVRFMQSIRPEPGSAPPDFPMEVGSTLWMSTKDLFPLNQDPPPDAKVARGKRKIDNLSSHLVGLSASQRNKRLARMKKDGTIAPTRTPRKLPDGTYVLPQGRQPGGLDWDSKRGVWIPKNS